MVIQEKHEARVCCDSSMDALAALGWRPAADSARPRGVHADAARAGAQDQVETVVPREAGARVLVVAGRHRGQRARLLSRSGAAGVVAVQLAAELDVARLGFDEICLFVGEAGEDE